MLNRRTIKLVAIDGELVERVAGKHQRGPRAKRKLSPAGQGEETHTRDVCAQPSATDINDREPLRMTNTVALSGQPLSQFPKGHLDSALVGKLEQLPLRAVRPAAAAPVANRAVAHAKRPGNRVHTAEFVDKGHTPVKDTNCSVLQDENVACIPLEYGHDTGMPSEQRTEFSIEAGRRFAAFRDALGLSQDELAEMLNSTRGRLSNFENGKKTLPPDVADKIWRTWAVSPNYFYCGLMDLVPDKYWEKLANPPRAQGIGRPTKRPQKKTARTVRKAG